MLTDRQLEIIKATVPALQAHGETITRTFYGFMFEAHPELKNIFNMAHQAKGEQPRALAESVLAYAANIDRLGNLGPAVERIAHKHASIDVLAEHYPIVGRNLLKAIGAVLGDAATPEIVDAWAAAYGQLADILIGVEADMYARNAERGWAGFKPFRVVSKTAQSDVITSFVLEPVDGKPLPEHRAGQYLSVRFSIPESPYVQMRQYTISCAPNPLHYRISVKREPGGLISNHLSDAIQEGAEVLVHMPHGEFILDETSDRPVAFLAGGVGVTPLLAMLERLTQSGSARSVVFVQAALHGGVHAFGSEVEAAVCGRPNSRSYVLYESPREGDRCDGVGQVSTSLLRDLVPSDADVYFCGPRGFMETVDSSLQEIGIPADRRHHETFGPTIGLGHA